MVYRIIEQTEDEERQIAECDTQADAEVIVSALRRDRNSQQEGSPDLDTDWEIR